MVSSSFLPFRFKSNEITLVSGSSNGYDASRVLTHFETSSSSLTSPAIVIGNTPNDHNVTTTRDEPATIGFTAAVTIPSGA